MKPLKTLLPILLIGAGVVGIAVYLYSKPSAVPASPAPQVAVKDEGKTINLAASGKGEGGTKATSTLQAFRDRIMKAKAEKNRAKRMALLSEAAQTLDPSQIGEALAELQAMKDPDERMQLRIMLLSRWGESDPKAALAYAQGLGTTMEKQQAIRSVLSSWAEKDFPAAKAWVEGLPAGPLRNQAMQSLAFALAQKDPVAAVSLARSLPSDQGYNVLIQAIRGWCLKDADAAIAYVAQLPAGAKKILTLQSMVSTLAEKDPDKAITLIEQLPAGDQNNALCTIGRSWGRSDPKAALDWANQQSDPEVKSSILRGVIPAMAVKDPKGALELAQSFRSDGSGIRDGVISEVLYKLSESDPKGAVGYAMNLLSSENKNPLISSMAGDWISNDPQGAIAWFGSLTDPKLKEQVTGMMITVLSRDISQENAAKAMNLLDTMPPGTVQNDALSTIAYHWARTDQKTAKAALDWANQQSDPEVKSQILQGAIQGMLQTDPNSAFQLAQSLPAGDSRNNLINNSLGTMAQSDPRSAIGLASGIADANLRSKAQQYVAELWKLRDPDAATQWVNSSSLPQDVKARLLQQK